MISKKPLPLSAPPAREVSLHLWPAGEERRAFDWKSAQSLLVRRRKPLLITFGLVTGHLLLALWMLAPLYRATATLKINTASTGGNESDLPVIGEILGAGESRTLTEQIEILSNDGVRENALKSMPSAQRGAVNPKSATVKAIPDTNWIAITTASRNAAAAAAYSNALAKTYVEFSRQGNGAQYATASRYLGQQVQQARARLDDARGKVANFKKAQKTADLGAETTNLVAAKDRVESAQGQAHADKEAALNQLNSLTATLPRLPANIVASSIISKSPSVVAKQASLTALESQLITAQGVFTDSAPEVQTLKQQITDLRRALQSEAQTEVSQQQTAVNPQVTATLSQIAELRGQVLALEARGIALKKQFKTYQAELAQLPDRERNLNQLNGDLATYQQTYDTLNQRYQSLRATQAARVASGSLLFPAQAPSSADARFTPLNLASCLLLASLLALALAALIDRIDSRVRSPRDLSSGGELPVLAQIPAILNGSSQSLLALQSPVSPLLENFRGLRTMLALAGAEDGQSVRTLVVTSSLPKEGKSLTALNLAVAAARGGERVVLVDCDLRRPSQHRLCNLPNDVGFINVAQGEATLDSALQTTNVPGLRVLTSGPIVSNPFHALNSQSGREILRRLAEIADFVVIDTPPVLVLADARITATFADSVLLVVSTEEPDREEVAMATELLVQGGANIAGIVLNKVAPGPEFRDYYSRYPYYTVAVEGARSGGVTHSNGAGSSAAESNGASDGNLANNGVGGVNSSNGETALSRRRAREARIETPRAPRQRGDEDDDEGTTMISYRPSGRDSDD